MSISVYMQLCEYSHYSNVISCFSVAPVKLLLLCTHVATLAQLLHKNILQAILFAAMHKKWATANATVEQAEMLDVGAQHGGGGTGGRGWS